VIATVSRATALPIRAQDQDLELHVFSCDYNGWADVPEEEREGLDAFEAVGPLDVPSSGPSPLVDPAAHQFLPVRWHPQDVHHHRKAA
jgi:hypothetical protein